MRLVDLHVGVTWNCSSDTATPGLEAIISGTIESAIKGDRATIRGDRALATQGIIIHIDRAALGSEGHLTADIINIDIATIILQLQRCILGNDDSYVRILVLEIVAGDCNREGIAISLRLHTNVARDIAGVLHSDLSHLACLNGNGTEIIIHDEGR